MDVLDCFCVFRTLMFCCHVAKCLLFLRDFVCHFIILSCLIRDCNQSTQRLFCNSPSQPVILLSSFKEHARKLTQHEKFLKASVACSQVASIARFSSKNHFQRRMKLLNDVFDFWKTGTEVSLVEIGNNKLQFY